MKFGISFAVAALLACAVFCPVTVSALEPDSPVIMRPVEKLGRGIANVAFCILELPMQWTKVSEDQGAIAGITVGTLKGVYYTAVRAVVGVVEVVTFPIPLPNCPDYPEDGGAGYGPMLQPAWIVPVGSDWNGFVYGDTSIVNPKR